MRARTNFDNVFELGWGNFLIEKKHKLREKNMVCVKYKSPFRLIGNY
jgi:hypothetical protein